MEDGTILFCLLDVAKALGYSKPANAVAQHCEEVCILPTPTQNQYNATVMQNMKYGKEGNVYRLAMKSKLPDAVKFQDWVCDEILPEIRKNGGYNQSGNYKVAYPYKKQINRLERLREIDRDRIELMQKWVLSLQEERNIYYQQSKACIGTVCTRNFSESENMDQLGEVLKSLRSEQNLSPSQLLARARLELPRNILTGLEKGKEDISLSNLFRILAALDCSIQFIRNED